MHHAQHNRFSRAIRFAALAGLLVVTALFVSQCTMVGERLTGVNTTWGTPTTCLTNCTTAYNIAVSLENKRHTAALKACMGKVSCVNAENTLHAQRLALLAAAYNACNNACHSQGGGHH